MWGGDEVIFCISGAHTKTHRAVLMLSTLTQTHKTTVFSHKKKFCVDLASESSCTHTSTLFIGCLADPSETAGGCNAWLRFQRNGRRHNGGHLVQPLPLKLTLTCLTHSLQYGSSRNSLPRMHFVSLSPTCCVFKCYSLTTRVSCYHKNVYY